MPGNRPERFEKAARSGADAVVLDLEDAVPLGEKLYAREAIATAWSHLTSLGVALLVRINATDSAQGHDDLQMLSNLASLAGVMVPKVETAAALQAVRDALPSTAILPLVESAPGYAALNEIAEAANVLRLVIGHIDFMADVGLQCGADQQELTPLRFAVAMATRLKHLAPAVDGVTPEVQNLERLREDTRRSIRFGFTGKLCIHPRQVEVVHDALSPDSDELRWAQRVVEADAKAGGAAVQLEGRMVDAPVVLQARRTLARSARRQTS